MNRFLMKSTVLCLVGGLTLLSPVLGRTQSAPQGPNYLSLNQVLPMAQPYFITSGQRLRKPGKERVTVAGTVSRDQGPPSPVQITWELTQRIRIDDSRGALVFDREDPRHAFPQDKQSADMLETLLDDSLEGFIVNQQKGSNRFLGSGYRAKGAGKDAPAYDIVEVWYNSQFRTGETRTVKQYWFDTRTKLLSRVIYSLGSGRGFVKVSWGDWRDVQGEKIPFKVERNEAGRTTLLLQLSSAVASPRAEDRLFPGR